MDSSPSKWPSLRTDMLEEITKRLDTRTDILHVRAVCSSWRSSVPLPPKNLSNPATGSPLQLPFPICPNKYLHPERRGYFFLKESTVYCMEPLKKFSSDWNSTKSWFVKIEDADSEKVRLKDPLSTTTIENLGKIGRLPNRVINLLDYKVREVGKAYSLEFVRVRKFYNCEFNELKSIVVKKVVVGHKNKDELWVMAIQADGKLGVWKMGDENWTKVDDGRVHSHFQDIAFHNGRFYAVYFTGLTIAVDPSSLKVTQVAPPMLTHGYRCRDFFKYLVNSLGNLFLIYKFVDFNLHFHVEDSDRGRKPSHLEVYKFNEEKSGWISVKGLGDQVMFVGDGFCYSVSARDFAGLKKNCVYFNDRYFRVVKDDFPGWAVSLFDLEEDVSQPLESAVGYSEIFWPPPSWLGQRSS